MKEIVLSWTDFKAIVSSKSLEMQYYTMPFGYFVFALDTTVMYESKLATGSSDATDFVNSYLATANNRISSIMKIKGASGRIAEVNANTQFVVTDPVNNLVLNDILTATGGQVTTSDPVQFSAIVDVDGGGCKCCCDVTNGQRIKMFDIDVPAGKKWYLTAWDGSGTMKAFYELLTADYSAWQTTLVDECDVTTGWTATNCSLSLDSITQKHGAAAIKMTYSSKTDCYMEKTYSPTMDWSVKDSFTIWAKKGSTEGTRYIKVRIYQGSSYYTFSTQVLSSDWTQYMFDLSEITGFDKTAISKIRVWLYYSSCYTASGVMTVDWMEVNYQPDPIIKTIDYFFNGSNTSGCPAHQHLFPTNIPITAGMNIQMYVTNRDSASGTFEVGLNGREVDA